MDSAEQLTQKITLAIVGDVHDAWEVADAEALHHLGVDLVLFVGDFGNESVEVVRAITALDLPKAVVFGNHDAWYNMTEWGQRKCPYDRGKENWVRQQIELVGEAHVGYDVLDFPAFGVSVAGGRPFSWGGSQWKYPDFYATWFGVDSIEASARRIAAAAGRAAFDTLIFLSHNGPTGLGDAPEDPCGKDWKPIGGDHGDPELAIAIERAKEAGKNVPLVVFGHMHHTLRHTQARSRKCFCFDSGTAYLNAASVPRIFRKEAGSQRNFSLVELTDGRVARAALVWIDDASKARSETLLYRSAK